MNRPGRPIGPARAVHVRFAEDARTGEREGNRYLRIDAPGDAGKRRIGALGAMVLALSVSGCQSNCIDLKFPDPAESEYTLPYAVGQESLVSQTCCNPLGGHRNRIAYDFDMPIGTKVLAARGGTVEEVVGNYIDGDLRRGHNNRILIRHEDGTIAWYGHLQHDSILVSRGDTVTRGQPIAACGNTGNTGNRPHLHFEVFRERAYDDSDAIPISFSNAPGPLGERGELLAGVAYRAVPPTN